MSSAEIHAYLGASIARKQHERVGPFMVGFTPDNAHAAFNYAVPDDGAQPTSREIEALVEVFRQRGLKPRLEYAYEAAPAVEEALLAAGFAAQARLRLMGCRPGDCRVIDIPVGFTVARAETDLDHEDAILAADEAYGEAATLANATMIAARQAMTAEGGAVVLAREAESGFGVGSGLFPAPLAGISELAAVGTRTAFRRRGIAAAVTSVLVGHALDNGIHFLWLTPESDQVERIYSRVGFARLAGFMIHISQPVA